MTRSVINPQEMARGLRKRPEQDKTCLYWVHLALMSLVNASVIFGIMWAFLVEDLESFLARVSKEIYALNWQALSSKDWFHLCGFTVAALFFGPYIYAVAKAFFAVRQAKKKTGKS